MALGVGFFSLVLSCGFAMPSSGVDGGDDSTEAIRARLAAMSAQTASSASGHFVVTGTNRLENVALGGWCAAMADRIKTITGLPVPFENRTVLLIVRDARVDVPGGAMVRHTRQGAASIHRVYLRDYAAAYGQRGRQAVCHAILAGYVDASPDAILALPPWLWKGIEQNLSPDLSAENMEQALTLW